MSFSGNQYPNFADKVITTRGDIVRGDSSGDRARYGIGAANTVLTSDGTDPAWAAHGGVPTTTKGDISGFSTTQARIPISTNNFSLYGDSAQALGLKWAASSTSVMSGTGDVLYASGANTLARLGIGSTDDVLTVAGGVPTWAAAGGGATVSTQTIVPSGQTTTSTSPVDITNGSITLANRTNGKASWIMYISGRNQTDGENMQLGVNYNGADQEVVATTSRAGGTNGVFTIATTDDLDGGVIKGVWAVSSSTGQISSGGTANSQIHVFEVS
jgi:hypothetical protein